MIGKCRCLRLLNSRRILEEEKRIAAKFVKKDIERYMCLTQQRTDFVDYE
jgi:hypothetical protein